MYAISMLSNKSTHLWFILKSIKIQYLHSKQRNIMSFSKSNNLWFISTNNIEQRDYMEKRNKEEKTYRLKWWTMNARCNGGLYGNEGRWFTVRRIGNEREMRKKRRSKMEEQEEVSWLYAAQWPLPIKSLLVIELMKQIISLINITKEILSIYNLYWKF